MASFFYYSFHSSHRNLNMIQNSSIKPYELKLKKFIKNSIHHQSMADCQVFMNKNMLNKFYQQLQDHLFQEKLIKQDNKRKRFSLEEYPVIRLNDLKPAEITTEPEWILSRAVIKSRVTLGKVKRKSLDTFPNRHKQMTKQQITSDMNYFVRTIKNSKTIRYIRSSPEEGTFKGISNVQKDITESKLKGIGNVQKDIKREGKKKPKLMNTNFQERGKMLRQLKKKASEIRHSTMV